MGILVTITQRRKFCHSELWNNAMTTGVCHSCMLRAHAHTALISYFHWQVAGSQIPSGVKTAQKLGWWKRGPDIYHSETETKRWKQDHLCSLSRLNIGVGYALQFQGLSSLGLFCSTPPLFYSISNTIEVLSKRQTIPILLVFLSCIPLVQYIHLLSSWWSSDLLEQQLFFTACIKQKK